MDPVYSQNKEATFNKQFEVTRMWNWYIAEHSARLLSYNEESK